MSGVVSLKSNSSATPVFDLHVCLCCCDGTKSQVLLNQAQLGSGKLALPFLKMLFFLTV